MKIALSGKMTSGKTLVADYLVAKYDFQAFAFADKLKEVVADLFGTREGQKDRGLIQSVGEHLRQVDPAIWLRKLDERVAEVDPEVRVVVTDVRYPNEYEWCRAHGFHLVLIYVGYERQLLRVSRLYPDMPVELLGDYSEICLDDMTWDTIILNDGEDLPQVFSQADMMVKKLERGLV